MARKPIPETSDAETELANQEPVEAAVEQPTETTAQPTEAEATLAEIRALNIEFMQAEAAWADSKEETARLKKLHEAAGSRLSARIARVEAQDAPLPLVDYAEAQAAWKSKPIDSLGLTETKNEKLREVGITTLGELAAYIEAANLKGGGVAWYADIDGIGQKAGDEIEDRLADETTKVSDEDRPLLAMSEEAE